MDLSNEYVLWSICLLMVFCGVFLTVFVTSLFMWKQVKWDIELLENTREREHDRAEAAIRE